METTWILVANASHARLFNLEAPESLALVKEFSHPQSRERASDLVTDKPGHYQSDGGKHGTFSPEETPKREEMERFAQHLAHELDHQRAAGHYQHLILVASPAFLGALNGSLNHHVKALVRESIGKDYVHEKPGDLLRHIKAVIPM
ncbi:MAG: host attachment protein [Gammaproteobacteria bacterium]|nr:host attachment protein [Gammaproteobacteria bacterium]